jgi:hypothetical protein
VKEMDSMAMELVYQDVPLIKIDVEPPSPRMHFRKAHHRNTTLKEANANPDHKHRHMQTLPSGFGVIVAADGAGGGLASYI